MANGWKIVSTTARSGAAPLIEYFVVAIDDRVQAISTLRERKLLLDAEITVAGEASADDLKRFDVKPGELLSVATFL